MKHLSHKAFKILLAFFLFVACSMPGIALGADQAVNSMMAGSPVTDYTAAVMGYMLLVGALVTVLLVGGFLVVNLGLLSKRRQDQTGHRDPSDVDLLKNPNEQRRVILPAEEGEVDDEVSADNRIRAASHIALVTEEKMYSDQAGTISGGDDHRVRPKKAA